MNAAFLLLTTAWLAGADAAPPTLPAPPAAAPGRLRLRSLMWLLLQLLRLLWLLLQADPARAV